MKESLKKSIQALLKEYQAQPRQHWGQHFLISPKALAQIVQAANLTNQDIVLEIGPGLGLLTKLLAKQSKKVIAVEKDQRFSQILKKELKGYSNLQIIEADILEFLSEPENEQANKVVANIPYYLTSRLIRLLLEREKPFDSIVLLVQKEIAQRICSQPPKMSLLALAVQVYGRPQIIGSLSKKAFWPQPRVDSAILKISQIKRPLDIDLKKFFQLVKAAFRAPRKTLVNNLCQGLGLSKEKIKTALSQVGLDPQARAEEVSLAVWKGLLKLF